MGIDACRKVDNTEYGLQGASIWKRKQYSKEGERFWAAFKKRQSQHFVFKVPPPTLWLTHTVPKNIFQKPDTLCIQEMLKCLPPMYLLPHQKQTSNFAYFSFLIYTVHSPSSKPYHNAIFSWHKLR